MIATMISVQIHFILECLTKKLSSDRRMTANTSQPGEVASIVASKMRVKRRSLTENAQNKRDLACQTYEL